MSNADITDMAAVIKEGYDPNVIGDTVDAMNVANTVIKNSKDLEGNPHRVPVLSGWVQNTSADPAVAYTGTSVAEVDAFSVTPVRFLNRCTVDRMALKLSRSDKGSFIKTITLQTDSMLKAVGANNETKNFRDGWGDIGIINASYTSGTSFTLATPQDAVNFERGMRLVFAPDQFTSAVRSSTAVTVVSVNRISGLITVSAAPSGLGAAANDWVFIKGDRGEGSNPVRVCQVGFGAYLPEIAPSSPTDNLFGLPRYLDPTRLGGLRLDVSATPNLSDWVADALALADQEGVSPDTLLIPSLTYGQFSKEIGTRFKYEGVNFKKSDESTVGVPGIKIFGAHAEVTVLPARKCPAGKAYLLTADTWRFTTAGEAVSIFSDDIQMSRIPGEDAYEIRGGGYGNLTCNEPGKNMVIFGLPTGS